MGTAIHRFPQISLMMRSVVRFWIMKRPAILIAVVAAVLLIALVALQRPGDQTPNRPADRTFVEDIGNTIEKRNLIRLASPKPNQTVSSPLAVNGEARGTWFFEASFPIVLLDANGKELVTAIATAQGEWMTEDFVPFTATLTFSAPETATGTLVLKKENPSGLPEHDDELRVPISFQK